MGKLRADSSSCARAAASLAVRCRMADSSSSTRRSTRAAQQPLSLAEEQAASVLSRMEQRDVAAALRLSLVSSWSSDEEQSDAEAEMDAEESSEEEEEEKGEAAPEQKEEQWSSELHAIDIPLPRLRHCRIEHLQQPSLLCSFCSTSFRRD